MASKAHVLDDLDRGILGVLQQDCKTPLVKIGEHVGLSAPAVIERIRKLEELGVIRGYHAVLDGRQLGLDITAFVGVTANYTKATDTLEKAFKEMPEILEAHYLTGEYSILLKVKVQNTAALESLLARLREIGPVERTHTMIALSSMIERVSVMLGDEETKRIETVSRRKAQ